MTASPTVRASASGRLDSPPPSSPLLSPPASRGAVPSRGGEKERKRKRGCANSAGATCLAFSVTASLAPSNNISTGAMGSTFSNPLTMCVTIPKEPPYLITRSLASASIPEAPEAPNEASTPLICSALTPRLRSPSSNVIS